MLDGWDGLGGNGMACIKNFHPASLSRVIAVQSEVVGQVGPDSLQLSLSLI